MTEMTRNKSQVKAEKAYALKRKNKARIPVIYLNDEEKAMVEKAFLLHGQTKKSAVLKGLELLIKKNK